MHSIFFTQKMWRVKFGQQGLPSDTLSRQRTSLLRGFLVSLAFLSLFMFIAADASATVIYVKHDATGSNDGTSWTNAYTNLQVAINAAAVGDELWVAAGTYKPDRTPTTLTPSDNRDKTFYLNKNIKIYGGFAGIETALSQRNFVTNVTTLSGDFNGNDVVTGSGSALAITNNDENAYHVLITTALNNTAVIDGLTIRGGNATSKLPIQFGGVPFQRSDGGGMNNRNSAPTISNIIFLNNEGANGAGLFNWSSAPRVNNVLFRHNRGQALRYNSTSSAAIANCTFWGNGNSTISAGIYLNASSVTVTNCTFFGNAASSLGRLTSTTSAFTVNNSIFWGNTAVVSTNSNATFSHSIVQGSGGSAAWTASYGTNGGNNLDQDPLFTNAAAGDFTPQAGSPAIDAGSNALWGVAGITVDLNNITRPQGSTVDIGSIEYPSGVLCVPPTVFNVVGGGVSCPGVGVNVGLSNSEIGVNYQLKLNGTNVGSPLAGTGAALDFGLQTGIGSYSVEADMCNTLMFGTANVTAGTVVVPSVTIASDDADNSVVTGTIVTFTATPTNGGTTPIYQWKKNSNNVGSGAATYVDASLVSSDIISVEMTSTALCPVPVTVVSNTITTTVLASATVIYVKHDATGSNDGTSWANAYTNLQVAINAAGVGNELWVAAGTYKPDRTPTTLTPSNNRDKTFYLNKNIKIYGGFAGTETTRNQRDFTTNITTLSGDFNGDDVVTGSGSTLSITNNSENSYHVLITASLNNNTVIDGFTVRGGNASSKDPINFGGQGFLRSEGGGIYNQNSSPIISNVIIIHNSAGANGSGIMNVSSAPKLSNMLFQQNNRVALLYSNSANATVSNSVFWGNRESILSSGIYGSSSSITVVNCTFSGNAVRAVAQLSGSLAVQNSILWGNGATSSGISLTNSIVQGSGGSSAWASGFGTNGGNNLDQDPLFTDAAAGDFTLQAGSPAIDAGSNTLWTATGLTVDFNNTTRPQGSAVDMGAFETAGSLPCVAPTQFNVTGGVTDCSSGLTVGLSNSELGVSYQLQLDSNDIGSPVIGTGAAISFGTQTAVGVYTVYTDSCDTYMTGTAEVLTPVVLTPSVSISSNDADNSISAGTSVTFTATPTNGGDTPTYQWKKNGANVGTNDSTYTDATIADGDSIWVEMTSSDVCASPTTTTSNAITMMVSFPITTQTWTQQGADIDGEADDDQSGKAVALSSDGTTVAIGADFNDGNGNNSGHVRVYKLLSGAWTQQGADIDGEAAGDGSGKAVALSSDGTTVAIGADLNDGNGNNSGHVRVYKFVSGAWTQQGADIDGEADSDRSGTSVALSSDGTTVAISAPGNAGNGAFRGHVRVYKLLSGAWTQQGTDIDGEADSDRSGTSVSLSSDGTTVAIGADRNDGNGNNSGHVRVYKLLSGAWTQQGADIDGEATGDMSGSSVSLSADGTTVAIGAPGNAGNGAFSGHVRVYKLLSGVWTQQGADIDGEAADDVSGYSVSLSADGTTIAIGAPNNGGNGAFSGHVRVYKLLSGVWTQQGVDIDGEAANNGSGWPVALSADGTTVAIGAPANAGGGTFRGHVRLFSLSSSSSCTPSVAIASDDTDNSITAGTSVTFTATPANGGDTPTYQWKKNGTNVGTNSATYTDATLANGDVISVAMTSSLACVAVATAMSDSITFTVLPSTPNVAFSLTPICEGATELLVPIIINDIYTGLGGISMRFAYDAALLNYHSVISTHPSLNATLNGNLFVNNVGSQLVLGWSSVTAANLQNGDTLFVIKFTPDLAALPATTANFVWNTQNGNSELAAITGNALSTTFVSDSVTISPTPNAVLSNSVGSEICLGDEITFTASGGATYEFFVNNVSQGAADTVNTFAASDLTDQDVISVLVTSAAGCTATATDTITVHNLPTATISANDTTICIGENVTFTATGGVNYEFFVNNNSQGAASTNATFASANLTNGDVVKVVVTNENGCVDTSSVITMVVNPLPTPTISASDTTICVGENVTFTATGGTNYEFFVNENSQGAAAATATFASANLANGDVVKVVATNANGCVATSSTISMIVNALPTPTISASDTTICVGENVTFTATGGVTYQFLVNNNSQDEASSNATFASSNLTNGDVVKVVATNENGCVATSSTISMIVNALPTATISASDTTICVGENVTFTATGGTNYEFFVNENSQGAASTNATFASANLANGDVVKVVATNANGCVDTSSVITMVVNPLPTATISASDTTICGGENVTFTATGGVNYEFFVNENSQGAASTNATFASANLANGDVVKVVATNENGCVATSSTITMVVNSLPTATISASDTTICVGENVTFTATGGSTYEFLVNNNSQGAASTNATFSSANLANGDVVKAVVTNENGCVAISSAITMVVNALPTATISASDTTICIGENVTFTATGGVNYEFFVNENSQGAASTNATSASSNLANGDVVKVVVTNENGCVATSSTITMVVNSLPTATISASDTTICIGENVTFTATGGTNYEFFVNENSQGAASSNATFASANLANGDVVKVVVTNENGCVATSSTISMIVNPLPTATISANDTTICVGENVTFTATGGANYEFFVNENSQGAASSNATFASANLANSDVIKVVVTNANGCVDTSSVVTMVVNSLPTATISASDTTICGGENVTFTATGGVSYEFFVNNNSQGAASTNATFASANLANGAIVKVIATNANGCVDTSSVITMVVNSLPTATISASDTTICGGENVTFTATGGVSYEFFVNNNSQGAAAANATFASTNLANGAIVKVVVTNENGCVDTSSAVTMVILPCYDIAGRIVYGNATMTPMGNVAVTLGNVANPQDTQTVVTSLLDGSFVFENLSNLQTLALDYATAKTHGGINATDALNILLHAVGMQNLTGINVKAANVDGTNGVNAADALLVLQRFVENINTFGAGDWTFEDRTYNINGADITNDLIYALAVGDVNGSYTPDSTESELPTVFLTSTATLSVTDGQNVQIPVRLTENATLGAMSLALDFPAAAMNINNITLGNGQNVLFTTQGNELRIAWADLAGLQLSRNDVVFTIDATVFDAASLNTVPFSVHAYSEIADAQAEAFENITLEMPTLEMGTTTNVTGATAANAFALTNFPNPFDNNTMVAYELPTSGEVNLTVRDILGRTVQTLVNETQAAGEYQINMSASNLAAGVYTYTLSVRNGEAVQNITRQMVITK